MRPPRVARLVLLLSFADRHTAKHDCLAEHCLEGFLLCQQALADEKCLGRTNSKCHTCAEGAVYKDVKRESKLKACEQRFLQRLCMLHESPFDLRVLGNLSKREQPTMANYSNMLQVGHAYVKKSGTTAASCSSLCRSSTVCEYTTFMPPAKDLGFESSLCLLSKLKEEQFSICIRPTCITQRKIHHDLKSALEFAGMKEYRSDLLRQLYKYHPTPYPTSSPTEAPTRHPTAAPSGAPTYEKVNAAADLAALKAMISGFGPPKPTPPPTLTPTLPKPTGSPSVVPSASPTAQPSRSTFSEYNDLQHLVKGLGAHSVLSISDLATVQDIAYPVGAGDWWP